jgi:hypothetical protein
MSKLTAKVLLAALCIVSFPGVASALDLRGAWTLYEYMDEGSPTPGIGGRLMLSDTNLTILYWVTDESGKPFKSHVETGTYSMNGDEILFLMDVALKVEKPEGKEESSGVTVVKPPRLLRWKADRSGSKLTLRFESGNTMSFTRATGE